MQMSGERIPKADPKAVGAPLIARVLADVGDEQVEESITVVVEENCPGRMTSVAGNSGLFRNVREIAVAVIQKEDIALSHAADKQIGVAVVVDVGERGAHARAVSDPDAG